MLENKTGRMWIATFPIVVASLLMVMAFITNGNAFAGDEKVAVDKVETGGRPIFNPFFANNPDLDRFFFERDVLGVGGDFADNPFYKQGNRNAFERNENFRADK